MSEPISFGLGWREPRSDGVAYPGKYCLVSSGPLIYGNDVDENIYFDDLKAIVLMNAAPALLEACKGMLESYELLMENKNPSSNVLWGMVRGYFAGEPEQSKAAIAAAEGAD